MRWENAYFTVEAALIFPFVMGTLLLIIFLFIFQYDRCLMEQDIGMLVLYAENLNTQDKDEAISLMKSRASEIYWDKYFAWKQEELQITIEKNEICVKGTGTLTFPVPEWNFINRANVWKAKSIQRAIRLNPVDFIRIYRRTEGGE